MEVVRKDQEAIRAAERALVQVEGFKLDVSETSPVGQGGAQLVTPPRRR